MFTLPADPARFLAFEQVLDSHHDDHDDDHDGDDHEDGGLPPPTVSFLTTATDTVTGGAGKDVFVATTGTLTTGDSIDGGGGPNVLQLQGAGAFDLNLFASLTDVRLVKGDDSGQQVTMRDGANLMFVGGSGDDTITGGTGNSVIVGGAGNDVITGGSGREILVGGAGDDTITAGSGQTCAWLGSGHNSFQGGAGTDLVFARDGTDVITAGTGQLIVQAGSGDATVTGGAGGDLVFTGSGTLHFTAGAAGDTVVVGRGDADIALGAGADVLRVGFGHGSATVTGFTHGSDKIDLSLFHLPSFAVLQACADLSANADGNIVLTAPGCMTLTLVGVASVTADDFTL